MAQPSKPTMLVVDDEPLILRGLSDVLEDEYSVVTAQSGREALTLLVENPRVAVILSDQRMPQMEGSEFLRQAKQLSGALRLLMTGYTRGQVLDQAVKDGTVQACLSKPFGLDSLRKAIAQAAASTDR